MFVSFLITVLAVSEHKPRYSRGEQFTEAVKQFKNLPAGTKPWQPSGEQKIVNGAPVGDSEATAVVGLAGCVADPIFNVNGVATNCITFCSGALIAPNVVLTAAHCLWDNTNNGPVVPPSFVFIRTSNSAVPPLLDESTYLTSYFPMQDAFVTNEQQQNRGRFDNDVGVLTLSNCVPMSCDPYKVNTYDSGLGLVGSESTVYGYGFASSGLVTPNQPLQQTTAAYPIISFDDCIQIQTHIDQLLNNFYYPGAPLKTPTEFLATNLFTDDRTFCTGSLTGDFTNTCPGDSGGPHVQNDVIVGVTSFGLIDCSSGIVSAHARVSFFAEFVESVLLEHVNVTTCGHRIEDVFAVYPLPASPPQSDYDASVFSCNVDDDTFSCHSNSGTACLETSAVCDGNVDCSGLYDEIQVCPEEIVKPICDEVFAANQQFVSACSDQTLEVLLANEDTFDFRCQQFQLCHAQVVPQLTDPETALACGSAGYGIEIDNGLTSGDYFQVYNLCLIQRWHNIAIEENWIAQARQCFSDDVAVCPTNDNANFVSGPGACACERSVQITYTSDEPVEASVFALTLANALYFGGDATSINILPVGTEHSVHTAHSAHTVTTHTPTVHENSPHDDMMGGMAMGTVHEAMSATEQTSHTVHAATSMGMGMNKAVRRVSFTLSYVNECETTELPSLDNLEFDGVTEATVVVGEPLCFPLADGKK